MSRDNKFRNFVEPAIHLLIWTSVFYLVWRMAMTLGPFRKEDKSIYLPLTWSTGLNVALFYINALYLIPRFIGHQHFKTYVTLVVLLYAGIVGVNSLLDHLYAVSLFSTDKEPLYSVVLLNVGSKFVILSFSLGYGFTKNWLTNEKYRQQLISEKLDSELKLLKAQINPHFLFNTLNMAFASAVKNNDKTTADIIESLSGLMRYVLYESNADLVPLEKEINYLNSYIKLQMQRLAPQLAENVDYRVEGDSKYLEIAPMILIPFIENVFKHGIMLREKPEVSISVSIGEHSLTLETKNRKDNQKTAVRSQNSGIGLENVKKRLKLLYLDCYNLEINDEPDSFHVKLQLQLNNSKNEMCSY